MATKPPNQPNNPSPASQSGSPGQGEPPAPQTQQEKDKDAAQAWAADQGSPPKADRTATAPVKTGPMTGRLDPTTGHPARATPANLSASPSDSPLSSEAAGGPFGGHFPKQAAADVVAFLRGAGSWAQAWAGFQQLSNWAIEEFGPDQFNEAAPIKAGDMPAPHGVAIAAGGPDAHPASLADALEQCSGTLTVADAPQRFGSSRGAAAAALPPWFLTVMKAILAFLESRKPNPPPQPV